MGATQKRCEGGEGGEEGEEGEAIMRQHIGQNVAGLKVSREMAVSRVRAPASVPRKRGGYHHPAGRVRRVVLEPWD